MTEQINIPQIDMAKIAQEVQGLSREQLETEALKMRVRQKKQQKKYQNPEARKIYQQKRAARDKALKEQALALGIWETVDSKAEEEVDRILEEEAEEEANTEVPF